ncbi:hypothetical protein EON83_20705 [bacterium]|nr:MAG: hypothetical protein EON83_20705 [bacterium]
MKMILKTCLFVGGVLAILVILLTVLGSRSGVKFEIVNLGPTAMKNVSVDVTGASYSVGDIQAGKSRWVKVNPHGESSVSIKHGANVGKQHVLFIDTYIESGYSGQITAQVRGGKLIHVKQNIKISPLG